MSRFASFFLHASEEEKIKVFTEAAKKANQEQRRYMNNTKSPHEKYLPGYNPELDAYLPQTVRDTHIPPKEQIIRWLYLNDGRYPNKNRWREEFVAFLDEVLG